MAKKSSIYLRAVVATQTEIAAAGLDVSKVLDVVVQRTQLMTRATGAVVELAEGDEVICRAASGMAQSALGLKLRKDRSLSGLCLRLGQPLKCDDALSDERVDKAVCKLLGIRSIIVVPLHHSGNAIGVLKVLSPEANAFDEHDVQTIQLICGLVASALKHAAAYKTKQEEAAALFYRATHDPLTGLANRELFFDRFKHSLAIAKREQAGLAVLLADVDGLKAINDTYGHLIGDMALKEAAARMQDALRESDTVARIGGDEFAILPAGVRDHQAASEVIQRLNEMVEAPVQFEGGSFKMTVSIGAAVFPGDGKDAESLVRIADAAMYSTKRQRQSAG